MPTQGKALEQNVREPLVIQTASQACQGAGMQLFHGTFQEAAVTTGALSPCHLTYVWADRAGHSSLFLGMKREGELRKDQLQ